MVTQAEKDDMLARIEKAQSVGATILSNMTAVKKTVLAWPVDTHLSLNSIVLAEGADNG